MTSAVRDVRVACRLGIGALIIGSFAALSTGGAAPRPASAAASRVIDPTAPIKHVVILFQENHSFDNVLGRLCVTDHRCDGATTARLSNGTSMALSQATDIVPNVPHGTSGQLTAMDGGRMDGFDKIPGCGATSSYRCLTQFWPKQIPNLTALARHYVISDRTFEMAAIPSFGAHLDLVATDLDGFTGDNPDPAPYAPSGPGWGCLGNRVTEWRSSPTDPIRLVPSCIPRPDGTGTFWDRYGPNGVPTTSPVRSVPTILRRLDQAGTSWKEYLYTKAYDICSYVRRCLDHDVSKVVDNRQILADAAAGQLPNVSFVLPGAKGNDNSQHNGKSMAVGDDWIGQVVGALQQGPEWLSTVVFITYDDCGCFYDHTPPPAGLGIRLPMVIVSPYARPGFTDSTATPYAGMLTFVEHLFGLAPLSSTDANAYDYANSFDFSQTPLAPVRMVREHVSPEEQRALDAQPTTEFDPT